MIEKHLKQGKELKGNAMVIDSFYGVIHSSTNTKELSLFLIAHRFFIQTEQGISFPTSNNMLTWMQSLTNEKMEIIFSLIIPIYEEQKLLRYSSTTTIDGCKFVITNYTMPS